MGRFKRLVELEEAMEKFIADYRIPNTVGLRYYKEGEWHFMRQGGEVVDVHEIYTIKYSHIYIFSLTFMLFCD